MRLILVGAGHAHLAVLAQAWRLRAAGLEPVLIAPATFHYSGLASAVLSGALEPSAGAIDIVALAQACGVPHRVGTVTDVDRTARLLVLDDGSRETFDLVSFNIGSTVTPTDTDPAVWPVKPLSGLFDLHDRLERGLVVGRRPALVISGDGQTAFEIAACVIGLHERHGMVPDLTLVGPGADASWAPPGAARYVIRTLQARGLKCRSGRVTQRTPDGIGLESGDRLPCGHHIVATGLIGPTLTATLDLPLTSDGRIRVSPTLQSVADPRVFAAGDCAAIEGYPRPFAGVFGVRAAGILIDNLCRTVTTGPLADYRPQKRWLSIMDLGNGTGLALRGTLWWAGRSMLWLKRRIDLGFVERSRAP